MFPTWHKKTLNNNLKIDLKSFFIFFNKNVTLNPNCVKKYTHRMLTVFGSLVTNSYHGVPQDVPSLHMDVAVSCR